MPLSNTTISALAADPYWDDFNAEKRFHRILFKPKYPVQTRELNQLQTIAQNQVTQLAAGIFKEGAPTVGGGSTFSNNVIALQVVRDDAVDINNFFDANTGIGAIVRGAISGASARVIQVATQTTENYASVIVVPISADLFDADEQVTFTTASTNTSIASMRVAPTAAPPTRNAATFSVQAGTFFIRGHLVNVPQQTIVLSSATNLVSARIGFTITEEFIDSVDDTSLLDPAFGATAYAAPGADRLRLTATLSSRAITGSNPIEQNSDADFLEIARVIGGQPTISSDRLEPSFIEETLARRTHDESGNYLTKPFRLSAKPHNPPVSIPNATGTISGNLSSVIINAAGVPTLFQSEASVGDVLVVNGERRDIATISSNTALTVNNSFSVPFSNSVYTLVSDNKLNLELESGKAYVYGHEFETLGTTVLTADRPRTVNSVTNGSVGTFFGPYLYVTRPTGTAIGGLFTIATEEKVDLHCVPFGNSTFGTGISNVSANSYAATRIGTARARAFVYAAGLGDANTLYKLYLVGAEFETKTLLGNVGGASNVALGNAITTTAASNTVVLTQYVTPNTVVVPAMALANNAYIGSTLTLMGNDGSTLNYYVVSSNVAVTSNSTANIATTTLVLGSNAYFSKINSNANAVFKFTDKSLRSVSDSIAKLKGASVDVLSKLGNIDTGNTVMIGADSTSLIFPFAQSWIRANSISNENFDAVRHFTGVVSTGSNATHTKYTFTAVAGESFAPTTLAASNFVVANSNGQFVTVSSSNTAVAVTPTTAELWLPTVDTNGSAVSAQIHVTVDTPAPRQKVLVVANTNTASVSVNATGYLVSNVTHLGHIGINLINTASPTIVGLGVPDVYRLQKVYAVPSANVVGGWVDVTERYTLDNGQRNWAYDYASIVLRPGYSHYSAANQALVMVDLFTSNSNGYFTAESYVGAYAADPSLDEYVDIPSFEDPIAGTITPLRDSIDFRPIRTANTATANTAANPYVNTTAVFGTQLLPHPDYAFEADYAYYLPRIDKVVLTKGKELKVLQGMPDPKPTPPADAEESMTLYTLTYPAYTANVAQIQMVPVDHRRYTMRDIGRLEKRIDHLEYYVQLSLAEINALNQTELDENDNERFKNGILIDSFASHAVSNHNDPDYLAAVDERRRELRPSFTSHGFKLGGFNNSTSASVSKVGTGLDDVILLNYTSQAFITQPLASTVVNINPFSVAAWRGKVILSPATDNWMDTLTRPTVVINLFNENDGWVVGPNYGFGTVWGDWQTNWTGVSTDVYLSESIEGTGHEPGDSEPRAQHYIDETVVTTTTATGTKSRVGQMTVANMSIISKNLGERVIDIAIAPYMRSANVTVAAVGLKPNANLIALFDETDVTTYIERANEVRLANSALASMFSVGETITSNAALPGTAKIAGILNDTLRVVDANGQFYTTGGNVTIIGATSGATTNVSEYVAFSGRFQGAGSTTSLTLDAGALPVTNSYYNNVIYITSGTGAGQRSTITAYDASTKVATINPAVTVLPTVGSTYSIGTPKADPLASQLTAGIGYSLANASSTFPGAFYGMFRLPGTSRTVNATGFGTIVTPSVAFNCGRRVFKLSDSTSVDDTTTQAETAYEASGFTRTVEATVVNTRDIKYSTVQVTQTGGPITTTTSSTAQVKKWLGVYVDPIAQTFVVDPVKFANGVFVTSVDLFFAKKDTENLPVHVQIRPTNNGYPASDRWLTEATMYPRGTASTINVVPANTTPNPANTSHYTRFTFPIPTYLVSGQEYSIVVLSDSFEYEVFVGEIGKQIIGSNNVISEQPYGGSFFKSQNASTWTAEQNQDLMFVINQAVFSAGGTAHFNLGETINSSSVGADSLVGTFDFDLVNIQTGHLDFAPTANSTSMLLQYTLASTNALSTVMPVRDSQDIAITNRGRIMPSNATCVDFQATLGTEDPYVSPVYDLARMSFVGVRNTIDNGQLYANGFTITNPGSGYTPGTFVITANDGYGSGATIVATANSLGEVASIAVTVNGSGYLETPALSWSAANGAANAVITYRGETAKSAGIVGENKARYITRRVTLADGFDASDIKVYFSACRPSGTNIDVYCKTLATGDLETFNDKPWQRMRIKPELTSVYARNSKDFHEYEYRTSANTAGYTVNGVTFEKFHTFAIKVVLRSTSTAVVPRIRKFRAIALDE